MEPSEETPKQIELIAQLIKRYPVKDVVMVDVFAVFTEPKIFKMLCNLLVEHVEKMEPPIDYIVGVEPMGFVYGSIISKQVGLPFVPIRKKGKLPGQLFSATFQIQYNGEKVFEIQQGSVKGGKNYLIVDDVLATGNTLTAARQLLEKGGAETIKCLVVAELTSQHAREKLSVPVYSIVKIDN